jgi:hypothetical protein
MRRAHGNQRDLFDEAMPELGAELRTRLTSVLQALLTEAASLETQRSEPDARGEGGDDDQDHA